MEPKMMKRSEVPVELTWDLGALYPTEEAYQEAVKQLVRQVNSFKEAYTGKLTDEETIASSLADMEEIDIERSRTDHYAFLPTSTDLTNPENTARSRKMSQVMADISATLSTYHTELTLVDDSLLDAVAANHPEYHAFIRLVKANKRILLDPSVERALAQLAPVLDAPYDVYDQVKLADMDFGTFEVDGQTYPLSFSLYEEKYMYENDTAFRRAAFDAFSAVLSKYKNTIAQAYYTQVQKEKIMASMRGFDSVLDYLLYEQEVDRDLYNRQIDVIMEKLAPVMREYITIVKEERGLDKMTYADLKIDLDPTFAPTVTIEQSKEYVERAISVLGDGYTEMIMKAYPERWIDFAQNVGKSTGGFCTGVSGNKAHPYILMSWTNLLSNVYTLIHELGHAGQMIRSNEDQSPLTSDQSMYVVEAASTFNELLLTDSLTRTSEDPRMERFAYTKMLADTYFHNFVTHLLEAAYQREVYLLIDAGESFDADRLSEIKRKVLESFWGDAVQINPGAELTWMRQPHYYMGLYPYTYSAGLTISTQAFLKMKEEGQPAVDRWLTFLGTGQQFTPVETAKVAGVDITTEQPLLDTIAYLEHAVDQIKRLTNELHEGK